MRPLLLAFALLFLCATVSVATAARERGHKRPQRDPWRRYLAPESVCQDGSDENAAPPVQRRAVVCLLNYARRRRGLGALVPSPLLDASAAGRAADIVRCGDFSHTACGRPSDQYAVQLGYHGSFGENLFAGVPTLNSPFAAMDAWLNSPEHRANIFDPGWRLDGVALARAPRLGDADDVAVWVTDFGTS